MQIAAHYSAAIDVLSHVEQAWREGEKLPLDYALSQYLSTRRYIGSKDRRAITDLVYNTMRRWGICRESLENAGIPEVARMGVLGVAALQNHHDVNAMDALCSGEGHAPATLSDSEKKWLQQAIENTLDFPNVSLAARMNMPAWLWEIWQQNFGERAVEEAQANHQAAATVVRVNTLRTNRVKATRQLTEQHIDVQDARYASNGLILAKRLSKDHPMLVDGLLEIQEEASQIAAEAVDAKPGMMVLDLCAGAGGKTLALAAAMKNYGKIIACDVDARRLQELERRAKRASVTIIETVLLPEGHMAPLAKYHQSFDRVLIDAPCSGLGTWRRTPDLVWRMTQEDIEHVVEIQQRLLKKAAGFLAPDGILVYVTCSVLDRENKSNVNQMLEKNSEFSVAPLDNLWNKFSTQEDNPTRAWLNLTPKQHDTDGFFIARLQRA